MPAVDRHQANGYTCRLDVSSVVGKEFAPPRRVLASSGQGRQEITQRPMMHLSHFVCSRTNSDHRPQRCVLFGCAIGLQLRFPVLAPLAFALGFLVLFLASGVGGVAPANLLYGSRVGIRHSC